MNIKIILINCLQFLKQLILIIKVSDKMENEKEKRQQKLADLFFEMGMDLDLIEKVSFK